jgi:hypothetical protein
MRKEILEHYFDSDLQVSTDRDPTPRSTLNGIRDTGIFYTILKLTGQLLPEDRLEFMKMITRCEKDRIPGLYLRRPGVPNAQGHDDYTGIAAASFHLDLPMAEDICVFGENEFYRFDVEQPDKPRWKYCHERFPGLVGFYNVCAKREIGLFRRFSIWFALKTSNPKLTSDATNVILKWLWVSVLETNPMFKKVCDEWSDALARAGGIRYFFGQYFGKDHPFSKDWIADVYTTV